MEIRWLGRSTFEIRSGASTVVFDPFPRAPRPQVLGEGVIVVTASHPDPSRVDVEPWRKIARVLEGPGEYEVAGLAIRGVPAPRSDPDEARAVNTVYVLEVERIAVCHLGVLQERLSSQALQMIGPVDIVFTPANGDGVLGPEEAAAVIRQIDPKIVIPMYYGSNGSGADSPLMKRLVSEIGLAAADPIPRLAIARGNLPAEMRVVVLRPPG